MRFRELCVLLPCHSLEDFPVYHTGNDAESLLACWTALWHPALLAAADAPPRWYRVDLPPEDLQEKLILVPTVSVSQMPADFEERASSAGAWLIRGERDRAAILDSALQQLNGSSAPLDGVAPTDNELIADFLALGYAFLQIQILTRQMRYASNLDEVRFFNQLLPGAKSAVAGQREDAVSKLTACFDQLAEERDHYYSVDAYLIDLTLLAEQTLGASLRAELGRATPINLLVSGETARALKEREPETLQSVLAGLQQGNVGLLGGEYSEHRLPFASCEGILGEFRRGQQSAVDVFERRIEVFGRRRFGLSPFVPGVLEKLRFRGALHATLDDGHFPSGSQVKTRWQGVDAGVIDAIAKPPLDASKPETFLSLAQKLGESMDSDHVATLCLAHWPGLACRWYEDLRRCARFTSALGKFVTVEHYFADTYLPGHLDRYEADQYRSPYLRQDVIRKQVDPISSVIRYWREQVAADAAEGLAMLASVVGSAKPVGRDSNKPAGWDSCANSSPNQQGAGQEPDPTSANKIDAQLAVARQRLLEVLPRQNAAAQPGYLVMNPCSFPRRMCVDVSQLTSLPDVAQPVFLADETADRKIAIVDVPSMGFAWLTSGSSHRRSAKDELCLVDDTRARDGVVWLRNEFIEASIQSSTGALQTFKDYHSRGNRLSQQVALRSVGTPGKPGDDWRDSDESSLYSVMAADECTIVTSSPALGEIEVRGRLLHRDGQPAAQFRQRWRLYRGSRVLNLEIEIQPQQDVLSDPWNSYYACRFAWSDESAELYHSLNETRQRVSKQRIEAPLYVELESGARRTALLMGGVPYHRRIGDRMLDSLLIVRRESERIFRFGIGLDLNQPLPEALALLAPQSITFQTAPAPAPAHCWLFHLDARPVVATHWSPLWDGDILSGVRVRLLESGGKSVRGRLAAFRPFIAARQVNFLGEPLSDLTVEQGKIVLDLAAHEWIEVEARWSEQLPAT